MSARAFHDLESTSDKKFLELRQDTHIGLFKQGSVLMLVVDVTKPWFDTGWITQDILFVYKVVRGLPRVSNLGVNYGKDYLQ